MPTRSFHLGDILSISHDRLVSPRHVNGVYDILNFMTCDDLFTHQLPRAARECQPYLRRQLPWLNSPAIDQAVDELGLDLKTDPDRSKAETIVSEWLAKMVETHGETHPVEPIPGRDHARIDPVIEAEMMTDGKVIVI